MKSNLMKVVELLLNVEGIKMEREFQDPEWREEFTYEAVGYFNPFRVEAVCDCAYRSGYAFVFMNATCMLVKGTASGIKKEIDAYINQQSISVPNG